jgi:hypothetical protein
MVRLGSDIDAMRVKVIVFRDYGCDGDDSMHISKFYRLPQDESEYTKFLSSVRAQGGGDGPENGFEAIYYAMQSEFMTGENDRQVIVLFTDADALDLHARADSDKYPKDMVDKASLKKIWSGSDQEKAAYLNQQTKRLVVFAPAETKYQDLTDDWKLTWYHATALEGGLGEIDFHEVIELIAKSASTKVKK